MILLQTVAQCAAFLLMIAFLGLETRDAINAWRFKIPTRRAAYHDVLRLLAFIALLLLAGAFDQIVGWPNV